MKNKIVLMITILTMIGLTLTACNPQEPEIVEKEVTRIVQEKVVETVIVESTQVVEKEVTKVVEKVITATPEPKVGPESGGTVIVALYQEPTTLNPYLVKQGAATRVMKTLLEGLLGIDPDGNYYPVLANQVPTLENGGISADGLQVTYNLRAGVKWSDGQPVRAQDVVFTWNAIMNADNQVITRSGYDKIESVEAVDDSTVVIQFSEFYAPFLTLFDFILPEHVLGDLADMNNAGFNQHPVGTGPFMVAEWQPGDYILLAANPNYREENKPYLDQLIFKIVPSRETGVAMLKTGEVDVMWDLVEDQIPQIEEAEDLNPWISPSINIERLILNLSKPGEPADPDAPHPILGDSRVRQAIDIAIDKQQIVDALLNGQAKVINSPIPIGWAMDDSLQPADYDPYAAKDLLEQAGWNDTDGDGIRDKDGQPLQLTIMTTSGNALRERVEQVLQAQFKAVGIDLLINNVASTVLFGKWADNAPRAVGNFDILLYSTGPSIDPDPHLYSYFHSSQIPTEENGGKGANYSRYSNPEVDQALDAARNSPDLATRKAEYMKMSQLIAQDLPHVMLYARLSINVFNSGVAGYSINAWENLTWDTQNWYLLNK
ncbi:MAG: peptide ABC transporter substrate-binding protein [Anaerolineales bacterium]|nr:peptide ABC transporter substrate-binding protein [Anaerolineales bacterium]